MGLIPKNRDHGWVPYVWLVFLTFFFFQPILGPRATSHDWLITIGATAIFLVLYFRIFWTGPPWNYALIVAMIGMGIGLGHINQGAMVFVILGSSFIAWTIQNSRWAYVAVASLILALAADALLLHAPAGFWVTSMVVSLGVGLSNIHFAEKNRADQKLRMANDEIEHLAKVAERERIARDLHDVLGHTLSLIIVKSTLAGKLIEKFPEKAKGEIADIEKVSREAMAEIRNTLRGYSTYKLCEELVRARAVLESAGVTVHEETAEVAMSPAQESVAALIMREAVTNVVRHAQARTCVLKIVANNGDCVMQIEDDGRGGIQVEGNGLRGMRERVEALGGTVSRDTRAGTRLTFEFPLNGVNGTH
ncbi:MAG TPA: sensor histidine kinase [Terriglobales bacterium]|jgi:two-component system sensor histidine kinase DesK